MNGNALGAGMLAVAVVVSTRGGEPKDTGAAGDLPPGPALPPLGFFPI